MDEFPPFSILLYSLLFYLVLPMMKTKNKLELEVLLSLIILYLSAISHHNIVHDCPRFEAFHTKVQHRILGINGQTTSLPNTNVEVYHLYGQETLFNMILQQHLGLFRHVFEHVSVPITFQHWPHYTLLALSTIETHHALVGVGP